METLTLMLLVALAILWAGAGVYWVRTRVPSPNVAVGSYTRRISSIPVPRMSAPKATVLPINSSGTRVQSPYTEGHSPGYSLLPPAVSAGPIEPLHSKVSSEQARLRRRNILGALGAAAVLSLLAALAFGGGFIVVHLLADALLLGFVLLVVQYHREIQLARTQRRPIIAPPAKRYAATGTGSH